MDNQKQATPQQPDETIDAQLRPDLVMLHGLICKGMEAWQNEPPEKREGSLTQFALGIVAQWALYLDSQPDEGHDCLVIQAGHNYIIRAAPRLMLQSENRLMLWLESMNAKESIDERDTMHMASNFLGCVFSEARELEALKISHVDPTNSAIATELVPGQGVQTCSIGRLTISLPDGNTLFIDSDTQPRELQFTLVK